MKSHVKPLKVLVDVSIIERCSENQRFSIPSIQKDSVAKKFALYHAKNGAFVFAIVAHINDIRHLNNR